MLRFPGFRTLAALTGVAAGLAVPLVSIGHGFSHLRASHRHEVGTIGQRAHVHEPVHAHDHDATHAVAVEAGEDHGHPRIDQAPTARADAWSPAVAARVLASLETASEGRHTRVRSVSLPGPAPPGQPPPRLRAPPLG